MHDPSDQPPSDRRGFLHEAAGLAAECGSEYVSFQAEAYGAGVDVTQGRIHDGQRRADVAIGLAQRRGWTGLPAAALAYRTATTAFSSAR